MFFLLKFNVNTTENLVKNYQKWISVRTCIIVSKIVQSTDIQKLYILRYDNDYNIRIPQRQNIISSFKH